MHYGMKGGVHQIGTVVEDLQPHSLREDVLIEVLHRPLYLPEHLRGVLITEQLDHALHSVLIVRLIVEIAHDALAL